MKLYELSLLISPNLEEIEIKNLNQEIKDFIINKRGIIENENIIPNTKLAYPINDFQTANLINILFSISGEELSSITELLKSKQGILRKIVNQKKKRTIPKAEEIKPIEEKNIKIKSRKVELKNITDKLNEILGSA